MQQMNRRFFTEWLRRSSTRTLQADEPGGRSAGAKASESERHQAAGLYRHASGAGMPLLGAAAVALGAIGMIRGDFTLVWHPVTDALPYRSILAYAAAVLFATAGMMLLVRRFVTLAGVALAALFGLLSIGWFWRVISYPELIGTWLGFAEQIAIAIGALAVAARQLPGRDRLAQLTSIAFGICQIVFALSHFISFKETVAMTPAWLPGGRAFWAIATGVAHLAGGIALITGARALLATRLLAIMFSTFGLLVWLPRLYEGPYDPVSWSGNFINLALVGAVLAVGDLLTDDKARVEANS